MEFWVEPTERVRAADYFRALIDASAATHAEAQTNLSAMCDVVPSFVPESAREHFLFEDSTAPAPSAPAGVVLRRRVETDSGPDGEWVACVDSKVIGAGGYLTHYNPPYVDLFIEVTEAWRGRGVGSYLVGALREVARADAFVPAARCAAANRASARTLERGGMRRCGEIIAGEVVPRLDQTKPGAP